MAAKNCFSTGSQIWTDKWRTEPACFCKNCREARSNVATNHDVSIKRQHIAVRFEIGLPLKQDEVTEAVSLLESLLSVLRQAQESPQAVAAVDPVDELAERDPSTRD